MGIKIGIKIGILVLAQILIATVNDAIDKMLVLNI